MTVGLQLGRPGVYRQDIRAPEPLDAVRLDVAGFAGVALRGPVDSPTPVVSWADYERRFGGFEPNASGRDRLLPYAVQAFFAQGGARAWIDRVVAVDGPGVPDAAAATAGFAVPGAGGAELVAADEGAWANALSVQLRFVVSGTFVGHFERPDMLPRPAGASVPTSSLLRIRRADVPRGVLRRAWTEVEPRTGRTLVLLDGPLPVDDAGAPAAVEAHVEVVTGTLVVAEPGRPGEQVAGLGLYPEHPRHPTVVLARESLLLRTAGSWEAPVLPDLLLGALACPLTRSGSDRSDAVHEDSFFDPVDTSDDPLDVEVHRGVDALGRVGQVGILVVPDLTWRSQPVPAPAPPPFAPASAPPVRARCCAWDSAAPDESLPDPVLTPPSTLDATNPSELAAITARQQRVVGVAEQHRRFVALLDVPLGLPVGRIGDWRAGFDSSYAGAFHPWLGVPRVVSALPGTPGPAAPPPLTSVLVPPSAFAAGIMADRERRLGITRGPANQLALGAVTVAAVVGEEEADRLHLSAVNVFAPERDGYRLSAARTLSHDQDYRQLSVRRLMTMLALTVERHGQWLVFEPNTAALRSRLTLSLTALLRGLHQRGAFSGRTEQESFFVRCDPAVNPTSSQALGRLVAEIGVAPAAPLEYLVLRISSDGDGGLVVGEAGRSAGPSGASELVEVGRG